MTRRRIIFVDPDHWNHYQQENPMTDDSYPPEWDDTPPPEPLDPRLGTALDALRPTSAERALVADLAAMYVGRDHDFAETFKFFQADRGGDHRWANVFLALLEQFATTAVGAQGEPLSIARAEGDRDAARGDIVEFGKQ